MIRPPRLFSNAPTMLIIRCKDQTTDLAVIVDSFLGLDFQGSGVKVIYRINDDRAVTGKWNSSTDGSAAPSPRFRAGAMTIQFRRFLKMHWPNSGAANSLARSKRGDAWPANSTPLLPLSRRTI
jgi:hypothetical protein